MEESLGTIVSVVGILISAALFLSVVVGIVVFARYKGTIDALKEAVDTYENLSEAYKAKSEQLIEEIQGLEDRVSGLEKTIEVQKEAMQLLVHQTLSAVQEYGVCVHSPDCKEFCPPQASCDPFDDANAGAGIK